LQPNLNERISLKTVYLTILALYILNDQFDEEKEQWVTLARKAKSTLKKIGVSNPDGLTRNFEIKTCWPARK